MHVINQQLTDSILKRGVKRTFATGKEIFAEGDQANFLPFVISGKVKMVRYPEPGKEVIIGVFSAGEVFAIPPALDGKRFPATAVAMEESKLLLLPQNEFRLLMASSPEFSAAIMERMCGLLRQRTETVQILATPSAEHRVAGVLIRLAGEINNGEKMKISHRRQDIAEMAGLTIETTIRSIRKLADRGLVDIVHGKIHIDSVVPLQRFIK